MGFYAPAQIVRDAREHEVEVRDADINLSDWDSTLENDPNGGRPALRLGLRLVDGLSEKEVHEVPEEVSEKKKPRRRRAKMPTLIPPAEEGRGTFQSVSDAARRSGVSTLEKLAAADAFRSLGLDRRQALWEVKALANAPPLPLFAWGEARDTGDEAEVRLPEMALSEHVVNDYQTLRLSLKAHPMSFLRDDFRKDGVLSCADLGKAKNGAWVRVAGVVLVRQRPGSGNVVFMTVEDETGIANAVIWPKLLEKFRKAVMTSRLILIEGRVQKQKEEHADIIHVVAARLIDRSDWLLRLSEWGADMNVPLANADEVAHPEPGSAHPSSKEDRVHPRFARGPKPRHPRNVRIIPKSRDFH
jgi:error-prone DNA polymerase